jgi:hypothetical protein
MILIIGGHIDALRSFLVDEKFPDNWEPAPQYAPITDNARNHLHFSLLLFIYIALVTASPWLSSTRR